MCWTLTAVMTPMPRPSRFSTSCQRWGLGVAAEETGEIDDLVLAAGVAFRDGGDEFELREDGLDIGGDIALDRGHHDILAALLTPPALVEHAEGFADAGGVTQKHFQPAAPLPAFFRLYAA